MEDRFIGLQFYGILTRSTVPLGVMGPPASAQCSNKSSVGRIPSIPNHSIPLIPDYYSQSPKLRNARLNANFCWSSTEAYHYTCHVFCPANKRAPRSNVDTGKQARVHHLHRAISSLRTSSKCSIWPRLHLLDQKAFA